MVKPDSKHVIVTCVTGYIFSMVTIELLWQGYHVFIGDKVDIQVSSVRPKKALDFKANLRLDDNFRDLARALKYRLISNP